MSSTEKEELNKSAGATVTIPCVKCAGKTEHEVLLSVDQSGDVDNGAIQWDRKYQIVRCKGCKETSFRIAASSSEDYIQVGDDEWIEDINEKLYPSRVEGVKGLGREEVYLPYELRNIYGETIHALTNDCPILAGIGLRALVETVCKNLEAEGRNLYEQINSLNQMRILTPAGAKILHQVRTLGNTAAHEVKPHTLKQLSLAIGVVEHMLKDIYILPKLVEDEFK